VLIYYIKNARLRRRHSSKQIESQLLIQPLKLQHMKRMIIALSLGLALQTLYCINLPAQETEEEKEFGMKISGFVKNDFFYDTRQTVASREGHFLLWPEPVVEDENGEDINAGANFNMLALQSRLSFAVTGPDALGARTSGLIEGDFYAQANDNIHLLRLRHAFVKLNWTHLEVLAGQYWNPLFITKCFPATISFNTGVPLNSYARNPQIRVSYTLGGLNFMAAALSQRDYASIGPEGESSQYLRNSAVPDMHFQVQYGFSNDAGTGLLAGAAVAYKTLVPRLSNTNLLGEIYRLDEKVSGITILGFLKLTATPLTVKMQARYGENISDLLAISGFAVREVTDLRTGQSEYTPLKSWTVWAEVHTNGNPQLGIFGGLTLNNGTRKEMSSTLNHVYGRETNIRSLYRISPRVLYQAGKVSLGLELEYTSAEYGSDYDTFYIPATTTAVANLRVLTSVYYFF
jgi:hypothetical protein